MHTLTANTSNQVCNCGAYNWLHHKGVGKCRILRLDRLACAACGGQSYHITTVDFGIGAYDYGEEKLFDTNKKKVTSCCHSEYEIDPRTGEKEQIR